MRDQDSRWERLGTARDVRMPADCNPLTESTLHGKMGYPRGRGWGTPRGTSTIPSGCLDHPPEVPRPPSRGTSTIPLGCLDHPPGVPRPPSKGTSTILPGYLDHPLGVPRPPSRGISSILPGCHRVPQRDPRPPPGGSSLTHTPRLPCSPSLIKTPRLHPHPDRHSSSFHPHSSFCIFHSSFPYVL